MAAFLTFSYSSFLCSLCSILVLSIDAAIEWGNMTRDGRADGRDVSDAEMALAKLKILSYGRILADPQPKYVCVCYVCFLFVCFVFLFCLLLVFFLFFFFWSCVRV